MSERGSNENQDESPRNEEDDFGEFGGFEAADPMETAAGGQAAAAPWVAIASASASGRTQPDLLCPQNSFPPYLDPSGIAGSPQHAAANNSNDNSGRPDGNAALFSAQFDISRQNDQGAERRGDGGAAVALADVLDGTFTTSGAYHRAGRPAANGMLPDIGLGSSLNPLFADRPLLLDVSQNALMPPEPVPQIVEELVVAQLGAGDLEVPAAAVGAENVEDDGGSNGEGEGQRVSEDQEVLPEKDGLHSRLQQELASIQASNLILNQQLERSQTDLAAQRSRLQSLQQNHAEQLEAVRQAGHQTLAVIVEEYKELSRTAVLEQQEATQHHLVEVMEQQLQSFHRALQAQRDEGEQQRDRAMQQTQDEMAKTLERLCIEQQEKFDQHLSEERRRSEQAVKQAMEEERSRCQEQQKEAVAAVQRAADKQLQNVKDECVKQLEEQRQHFELVLQEQCQHEREQAQERLKACLEEERQRGQELTDRLSSEARVDRQAYARQQRQSDAAVRRRQLASLDLFLESARRQIDLLLNSDPLPEALPPTPSLPSDSQEKE